MNRVRTLGRTVGIVAAGVFQLAAVGFGQSATDSPAGARVASGLKAGPDGPIATTEPGWPQWRGPRRDGISQEKGLLPDWPKEGPPLAWKVGDVGRGWSSPIVVGDRIYITGDVDDDLVVFAFDLQGKLQWRSTNGAAWKNSFPGARATCAYSQGRLYHMNAHGRVACLDAASGREVWAVNVLERFRGRNITWGTTECLLVDGPRLIVTPGGAKASMAALDKTSGETVWTTQPIEEDRVTHTSPLLFRYAGRRLLASCTSKHGFGADADTGKLLWMVPLENRYGVNVTPPVFGDGSILYVTAYAPGICYRLRPEGDGIQAEETWTSILDTCTGGAVLVDGVVYAGGYSKFRNWIGVDWKSGQTRCELKTLASGAAICADGRFYCLAQNGTAALVKPASEGFELAGQFRLVPGRLSDAWAHPVLLDGRLYLRYHDTLWCYDVRAK